MAGAVSSSEEPKSQNGEKQCENKTPAADTMAARSLIIMCGPSGAGKSTLIKRLQKDYPGAFGFSVSHTTRDPREGEKDGVDYNFVTKDIMDKKIAANEMLEYAHVHKNTYGTSIDAVQKVIDEKRKCILDIDVQGVESVKKSSMDEKSMYIFLSPPDIAALEARLRSRGTETEEKIQTRLTNAKKEMEYKDKKGFWDRVIVNDDVDTAYMELEECVAGDLKKDEKKEESS